MSYLRPVAAPVYVDTIGPRVAAAELNWLDQKGREFFSVVDQGADPTGVTDSTVAITGAISTLITAGGGILYFPPGTYLVGGTGAITNNNGAAIVFNNVAGPNNAAGIPITLIGAGKSVTTIKLKNNNNYNIIEIVDTTNSNVSFPITIKDLTLDGNGANQVQQVAGDRYQNCFCAQGVNDVKLLDIAAKGASYHGLVLNALQNGYVRAECFGNYADGVLLTGNPGTNQFGLRSIYDLICHDNGIVVANQYDTGYTGCNAIYQRDINFRMVSMNHVNSVTHAQDPNSDNLISGGALYTGQCFNCYFNIVSNNDYAALTIDSNTDGCTFDILAYGSLQTGMRDGPNGTSITNNIIRYLGRTMAASAISHFDFGRGTPTFKNNQIEGTFLDIGIGGGNKPIGFIGAGFAGNRFQKFVAGDFAANANISYLIGGVASGGNNFFGDGHIVGTLQTGTMQTPASNDILRSIVGMANFASGVITAGASAWTSTSTAPTQEDAIVVLTAANGISAMQLSGIPLPITTGTSFFLKAGKAFVVAWATTAPTFQFVFQP